MREYFMITEEQYKAAVDSRKEQDGIITAYHQQGIQAFKERWERFDNGKEVFKDEELTYAADCRCQKCKAGMAYPKDCGPWHQWTCSAVLKGIGTDNGHSAFPFSQYEIKSEKQPSANGVTTRPVV